MKKYRDSLRLRFWCMRRKEEGVPVKEICCAAQVPRRTFYNWLSRYRFCGLKGLKPGSRAPRNVRRMDSAIADKVVLLRRERGWSPKLISEFLRTQGVRVSSTTVYRILRKTNLIRST